MKILLIVDKKNNWSIHNRAKQLKKYLPDWEVEIKEIYKDGITHEDFELNYRYYDIIHFASTLIKFKKFFEKFPNTMTTSLNSHGCISGLFGNYEDLVVSLNNKLAHCFDKGIDYIDLFFTNGRSVDMVYLKVNKIVIDNIFIGKKKYKILLKLKLPKELNNGRKFPTICFKFFRKTKKVLVSIPETQIINDIKVSKNVLLTIN